MNRGVPSIEETNTKITWTFFGDRFHVDLHHNSVNYANGLFKVYTKHYSPFLFYF